jgi:biotin carboxylase
MIKKEQNIIAYVMNLPASVLPSVRAYQKKTGKKYKIMLIRDSKFELSNAMSGYDILVTCDFSKPHSIAQALLPYQDSLLAISCRSEASISRFAKVIPHVPYLRTPNSESLIWATDKYEMRKRFKLFDPKCTPKFTRIKDISKEERKRAIQKIGFPMIVKPTNLAASLFVTICYHEEELEKALKTAFRKINKAYEHDRRMEEPKIIAEEYMEGDMYSIDSYVNTRGEVSHCPLVRVKTGKDIGHDDFYNYLQVTPTALKRESIEKAHVVAETAIHALGLRNTTTHTELMKMDDVWKIIEIGPRMGGFRDELHQLSCDIDHSLNDILIRIPKKPIIPKKCKGFAAAMKWFAAKEGRIIEMKGIKKIEQLESFHKIAINKKVGDRAVFARNGGRSIFNVFLYNAERPKLLADIRRLEQLVKIKVK